MDLEETGITGGIDRGGLPQTEIPNTPLSAWKCMGSTEEISVASRTKSRVA